MMPILISIVIILLYLLFDIRAENKKHEELYLKQFEKYKPKK
jgi:hypothetical protein